MRIYLLRHGIAEEGRAGHPDSERALTPEGGKKLKEILRMAKSAGVAPDVIISSPYRRAFQTAEIAVEVLKHKDPIVQTEALVPSGNPADVWNEIRSHRGVNQLMLVGHQPLFGYLLAYLLNSSVLKSDFKKGAIACVEVQQFSSQPKGTLRWFLTPKFA